MHFVYLLLGSNIGDSEGYLRICRSLINRNVGKIIKASIIFETEPWGFDAERYFLNQTLLVRTDDSPEEILTKIHTIEDILGRKRDPDGYQSRTIDIDILFYDALILNQNNLIIPHPSIGERMFTLKPLIDLDPDFIHPVRKLSIRNMVELCADKSIIREYKHG